MLLLAGSCDLLQCFGSAAVAEGVLKQEVDFAFRRSRGEQGPGAAVAPSGEGRGTSCHQKRQRSCPVVVAASCPFAALVMSVGAGGVACTARRCFQRFPARVTQPFFTP